MLGVGVKSYGSNISQLLNVTENSIDWCVHIKSHMFDQILTLDNHMKCDFPISAKNLIDYTVDDLLGEFIFAIAQGTDVLRVNSCDNFLLQGSLNRKDLFEGQDQFFVVCLHWSDDE